MEAATALQLTDDNFKAEVTDFKGLVLVDFWAPWCTPCLMMTPFIEQLAVKYAGNPDIKIAQLNVDEATETAGAFRVMSIPTITAFVAGVEQDAKIGVQPVTALDEMIRKNAPKPAPAATATV